MSVESYGRFNSRVSKTNNASQNAQDHIMTELPETKCVSCPIPDTVPYKVMLTLYTNTTFRQTIT